MVSVGEATPPRFRLAHAPNPVNPSTTIRFTLEAPDEARLSIYDVNGRLLRSLFVGRAEAGETRVSWDGRDDAGSPLPSGVYLYRLQTSRESQTRKLSLVR